MKKKIGIFILAWMTGAFLILSGKVDGIWNFFDKDGVIIVHAKNNKSSNDLQKQITQKQQQQKKLEEEKKQLEKDISSIENKKGNVVEYIESLDKKLNSLSQKIVKNNGDLVALKKEMRQLKKQKKQAESDKKIQYDTMKKRIKYMYENGNTGYLEVLLTSNSLSDFFNRAEYVAKVSSYDNHMLSNYKKVCVAIEETKNALEVKIDKMQNLKQSLAIEEKSVNDIVDKKTKELNKYQIQIKNKSSDVNNKNNLLEQQENELELLMVAQRKKIEEEVKAQQAAAQKAKEEQKKKKVQKKDKKKNNSTASKNNTATTNNNKDSDNNQSQNTDATKNNTNEKLPVVASAGGYSWPLSSSGRISSTFGYRNAPTAGASTYHKGIDISVPVGTSVRATKSGTVVTSSYSSSAGNYIAIYHGSGIYSYYMHCSRLLVSSGQKVSQGQQIALSGNTGVSTGPHLHFAIYANGSYVNPLNYVSN